MSMIMSSNLYKTYCQTRADVTTLNYTWEINSFWQLYTLLGRITSEPFPDESLFNIHIQAKDQQSDIIQFYVFTKNIQLPASYDIYLAQKSKGLAHIKSQAYLQNTTLLCEITTDHLSAICPMYETLVVRIKFRFYHMSQCDTVHFGPFETHQIAPSPETSLSTHSTDTKDDIRVDSSLITVVINNNNHQVRKDVLSSSSSVFKMMIEGATRNEIVIPDLSYSIFEEIFLFITVGIINFNDDAKAIELLKIADRYDIKGLKLKCEKYLVQHITLLTAVEFMEIALSFNAEYLEEYVASFIKLYIKILVPLLKFEDMQKYPKAAEAIIDIRKGEVSSTLYMLNEVFV